MSDSEWQRIEDWAGESQLISILTLFMGASSIFFAWHFVFYIIGTVLLLYSSISLSLINTCRQMVQMGRKECEKLTDEENFQ